MGYYLPDLIKGIDVECGTAPAARREICRCGHGRRMRLRQRNQVAAKPASSAEIRWKTSWPKGSGKFQRETAPPPQRPFKACSPSHPDDERATYGLAVASALQGKPEQARELFTKVIAAAQNPLAGPRCTFRSVASFLVAHLSRENVRCRGQAGSRRAGISRGAGGFRSAGYGADRRATRNRDGVPDTVSRQAVGRQVVIIIPLFPPQCEHAEGSAGAICNPLGAIDQSPRIILAEEISNMTAKFFRWSAALLGLTVAFSCAAFSELNTFNRSQPRPRQCPAQNAPAPKESGKDAQSQ